MCENYVIYWLDWLARVTGLLQDHFYYTLKPTARCLLSSLKKSPWANLLQTYFSTTVVQMSFFVLRTYVISESRRPPSSITLLLSARSYKEHWIPPAMRILMYLFRWYSYQNAAKSFAAFSLSFIPYLHSYHRHPRKLWNSYLSPKNIEWKLH